MPALQGDYSQYLVPAAEQRARAHARRAAWFAAQKEEAAPNQPPSNALVPSANIFPWLTLRRLLAEVAAKHHLHPSLLASSKQTKYLVAARREFIYRAATETNNPLSAIGRFIGRDHSTVLHHLRSYCRLNDAPNPRATA